MVVVYILGPLGVGGEQVVEGSGHRSSSNTS